MSCTQTASCDPGDHTYSWPCDYAPGTGPLANPVTRAGDTAGDDDRQRAAEIVRRLVTQRNSDALVDGIAVALAEAEQRGAARAVQPFRELADELDRCDSPPWLVLRRRGRPDPWVKAEHVSDRIRAVAEEADRRG